MNIPGMGNMLKQMQKMQEDLKNTEKELSETLATGTSGAGLVEVAVDCNDHYCKKVRLDSSLKNEDNEFTEDLIVTAFNDAINKAKAIKADKMGGLTSGFKMPAGLDSLLK